MYVTYMHWGGNYRPKWQTLEELADLIIYRPNILRIARIFLTTSSFGDLCQFIDISTISIGNGEDLNACACILSRQRNLLDKLIGIPLAPIVLPIGEDDEGFDVL